MVQFTHLQVIDGIRYSLFVQWMIDQDVERLGGASKPSQCANPSSPNEVIGNRQQSLLYMKANPAS
jgi:hypothetical protein